MCVGRLPNLFYWSEWAVPGADHKGLHLGSRETKTKACQLMKSKQRKGQTGSLRTVVHRDEKDFITPRCTADNQSEGQYAACSIREEQWSSKWRRSTWVYDRNIWRNWWGGLVQTKLWLGTLRRQDRNKLHVTSRFTILTFPYWEKWEIDWECCNWEPTGGGVARLFLFPQLVCAKWTHPFSFSTYKGKTQNPCIFSP